MTIFVPVCIIGAALTGTRTVPASPVNRQASRKRRNRERAKGFRVRIKV
ncbi:MAG: hypothetical protein HGA79_05690 [Anaerolineales bacterium]|jgi:hypothetical protein|nr:hypothetical protein [Anaerolineales bacterium]